MTSHGLEWLGRLIIAPRRLVLRRTERPKSKEWNEEHPDDPVA